MKSIVSITTTTAILAAAMDPEKGLATFNAGTYKGTKIAVRQLTGQEIVTVSGMTSGAKVITAETWIADRFGKISARQIKQLRDLITKEPTK